MAEALGVAAATVQFIDVALRLSAMLSRIVSEYRDAPRELAELKSSLISQISLVEMIRENTDHLQTSHKDQCNELASIMTKYREVMDSLLILINKIHGTGPKNGFQRSWTALMSLHKKSDITGLCEKIDVQRNILLMWMSNANLLMIRQNIDATHKSHIGIERLLVISQNAESATRDIDSQMKESLPLIHDTNMATSSIMTEIGETRMDVHRVSTNVAQIDVEIRRLGEQFRDLGSSVRVFESLLGDNNVLQESIRNVAQGYENVRDDDASSTSIARAALMETRTELALTTACQPEAEPEHADTSTECQCRHTRHTAKWEPLSLFHFKRVFTRHHYASCPQFKSSNGSLEVMMHLIPPQWLLKYTVNLSLQLWRWRETGFMFVPAGLNMERVVDSSKSASFRAIENTGKRLGTFQQNGHASDIKDLKITLSDLFQAGEASALDVNADGAGLLHEVLWLYNKHRDRSMGDVRSAQSLGSEWVSLINFLLISGANPNSELTSRRYDMVHSAIGGVGTVFDVFASTLALRTYYGRVKDHEQYICCEIYHTLDEGRAQFSRPIISRPINSLVNTAPKYLTWYFPLEVAELISFPEQIEHHGPLVAAILGQSEKDLVRLIRTSNVDHVSKVNGLSAVHFAVNWPFALKLLIEANANVDCEDRRGRRPINLAVELGEYEALQILIEADCCLWTVFKYMSPVQKACFNYNNYNRDISYAIIDATINRVRRIYRLGAALLPQFSLYETAHSDTMSEHAAVQIISDLIKSGKKVPKALQMGWTTSLLNSADVDGAIRIPVEAAERYWQAGFRNLTAYDDHGLTPMFCSWFAADFKLMSWLVSKGVPLSAQHQKDKLCGLHYYARRLHYPGGFFDFDVKSVPAPNPEQSSILWNMPGILEDDCTCPCSPQGCTPISKLFQRYNPSSTGIEIEKDGELLTTFWEKTATPSSLWEPQLYEFLRITLFDLMGCNHSCCYLGHECKIGDRSRLKYLSNNDDEGRAHQRRQEFQSELQICMEELSGLSEKDMHAVVSILKTRVHRDIDGRCSEVKWSMTE